jgi:hypothetical protein
MKYILLSFLIIFIIPIYTLPNDDEHKKIYKLIKIVEESNLIFIRNNSEYTNIEASNHLRKKYEYSKEKLNSAEEFIKHIASRSSITGKPYLIKKPNNEIFEAEKWLIIQLKNLQN